MTTIHSLSKARIRSVPSQSHRDQDDPSNSLLPSSDHDLIRPIPSHAHQQRKQLSCFTRIVFVISFILFLYMYFFHRPATVANLDPMGFDEDGHHALDISFLTLIVNVTVYQGFRTSDHPHHGILIRKNRIVRLLSTKHEVTRTTLELEPLGIRVINGHGVSVLPGLIDAHLDLLEFGFKLLQLDLSPATSIAYIRTLLTTYVSQFSPGYFSTHRWLRAYGWDHKKYPDSINKRPDRFPTANDLDIDIQEFQDIPILLKRWDGHAYWVNNVALQLLMPHIPSNDYFDNVILRDTSSGRPTGLFLGSAMSIVDKIAPPPTHGEIINVIQRAQSELHKVGLTSVHFPGVIPPIWRALQAMDEKDLLDIRIYAMAQCSDSSRLDHIPTTIPSVCPNSFISFNSTSQTSSHILGNKLSMRSASLVVDGSLEKHSAALLEPYTDRPDHSGNVLCSDWMCSELIPVIKNWTQHGWQVSVHATGDHANKIAIQSIIQAGVTKNQRPRIENSQVLQPEDINRLAEYSIIPSIQSISASVHEQSIKKRLGEHRSSKVNAWRLMLDAGIVAMPMGSGILIDQLPNPFLGMYVAETMTKYPANESGKSVVNHGIDQLINKDHLTRYEVLRGYTEWAAYSAFMDQSVGRLDPGMLADMTIVDQDIGDPERVTSRRLIYTKVIATMVNGMVKYVRDTNGVNEWQKLLKND